MIFLIAAMDKNRVIGNAGKLPWRLPADFAYFKATTLGHPVIMGRTTFESIGRPLPGRKNIVLTRGDFTHEGVVVAHSFDEARTLAEGDGDVFVIGGSKVYEEALPHADRLYITFVEGDFAGDTFFPEVDWSLWREVSSETRVADGENPHPMKFSVFERV